MEDRNFKAEADREDRKIGMLECKLSIRWKSLGQKKA